jgi:hypothetical protein
MKNKQINVDELSGEMLDYHVALAEGWSFFWSKHNYYSITAPDGERHIAWDCWSEYDPGSEKKNEVPHPSTCIYDCGFFPSFNWDECGPLIEKYRIHLYPAVDPDGDRLLHWVAVDERQQERRGYVGADPMVAVCRCIAGNYLK